MFIDWSNPEIQLAIVTGVFGIASTLLAIKVKNWNDARQNKDSKEAQIANIISKYEQVIRNQAMELDRLAKALGDTRTTLDNVHKELYSTKQQNYALQNQISAMKIEVGVN